MSLRHCHHFKFQIANSSMHIILLEMEINDLTNEFMRPDLFVRGMESDLLLSS